MTPTLSAAVKAVMEMVSEPDEVGMVNDVTVGDEMSAT